MKYLIVGAILAAALANIVGTGYTTGLTDWNHDGIPD